MPDLQDTESKYQADLKKSDEFIDFWMRADERVIQIFQNLELETPADDLKKMTRFIKPIEQAIKTQTTHKITLISSKEISGQQTFEGIITSLDKDPWYSLTNSLGCGCLVILATMKITIETEETKGKTKRKIPISWVDEFKENIIAET